MDIIKKIDNILEESLDFRTGPGIFSKLIGTSYQGELTLKVNDENVKKLDDILGPHRGSGDGKVKYQWAIYFPNTNQYVSIYDYRDDTVFHVGGKNSFAIDIVEKLLREKGIL